MAFSLAGKTAFITGASRGIGLEIGKVLAAQGANVVVAAKTVEPHPKLPGTIYTAAEELDAIGAATGSGARALPLQLDIRDAAAVQDAIAATKDKFGALDIVVNNASAISMKPTLEASVKSYDLMNSINSRGSWLVAKHALPLLLESSTNGRNPQILTLSPPLTYGMLDPTPSTAKDAIYPAQMAQCASAYAIAKFGMSLLTLSLSAELFGKVAVNSLWPYTLIGTSAMKIVSANADEEAKRWRSPTIVAQAALRIFQEQSSSSPDRPFTGQFLVDEIYLRQKGLTTDQIKQFNLHEATPQHELAEDLYISQQLRDAVHKSRSA
ncbi:NAD(P)-binding protein [Testicularia cyperi]|uniref:NAD(P)-binding protein n=1 Tax=Testicularia cyperi TaxID=1882483 RepID=A0A317XQG7_9BASI|nr:NAD(P)-binding protein [Testicularia cyperi]